MNLNNQTSIYQALQDAYPDDASILIKLCNHGLEQPLGLEHPSIIQELIGRELSRNDFKRVQLAYVLITAYYFLLDGVVDGHLDDPLQPIYLTHLLTFGCQKIDEVMYANSIDLDAFNKTFHRLLSENAKAIVLENKFRSNALFYSEQEEFDSIVGRSNSAILLLEIIGTLTETKQCNDLKDILNDFAFFVQLGDDLADWREDYRTKNYTSFLREIFCRHQRVLSEKELEEEIYLSNNFELRALKIIRGLQKTTEKIDRKCNGNGVSLKLLIEQHIVKIKSLMTQIISIKMEAPNRNNAKIN